MATPVTNTKGLTITASSTDVDILEYLIVISSSISPATVVEMVKKLPANANSRKIGSLAVGAGMSVKKVLSDTRSRAGIVLGADWMINNDINFTILAMLGHMIMMLPAEEMTEKGKNAKNTYIRSIGGVSNVTFFTAGSAIAGKDKRSEILLKWSKQLAGFNIGEHQEVLARAFPHLVLSKKSFIAKLFYSVMAPITFPFRAAYAIITAVFQFLLMVFWNLWKFVIPLFIINLVMAMAFPNVMQTLTTAGTGVVTDSATMAFSDAVPYAITKTGTQAAVFGKTIIVGVPSVATSMSTYIPAVAAAAVSVPGILYEAYETSGASVTEEWEKVNLTATAEKATEAGKGVVNKVADVFFSSFVLNETESIVTRFNDGFSSSVMMAFEADLALLAGTPANNTTAADAVPPASTVPAPAVDPSVSDDSDDEETENEGPEADDQVADVDDQDAVVDTIEEPDQDAVADIVQSADEVEEPDQDAAMGDMQAVDQVADPDAAAVPY